LEDAFMNNKTVEVLISFGSTKLKGNAIITDFPLSSVFNKEFKYNIKLLGTGALVPEV
jgi:predicted secreted protein